MKDKDTNTNEGQGYKLWINYLCIDVFHASFPPPLFKSYFLGGGGGGGAIAIINIPVIHFKMPCLRQVALAI